MDKQVKIIDWKDVYKFPLDLRYDCKVMTLDFNMAFDFIPSWIKDIPTLQISVEDKQKIVRIINGSSEIIENQYEITYKNGTIYVQGLAMIWIRGWGNLIGGGGLNLDEEKATKIQNDFADYIVETLKKAQLTSEGGLNLSDKKAIKTQNDFDEYIIESRRKSQ